MPTMLPGGYRSPYAQTIAELMMRQGDIAARSAERSGQIWGNAVQNLGQIGAQAYEQHQEEKKQKAQSAALDQFVQSGAWHDPDVALAGSVKILGPERGAKFAEGLVSAARLHQGPKPEEAMKALPGIIRGLEAAPDDLKPGLYSSARNLVVSSGIARPQDIPEQYDPRMMSTLSAWANEQKTAESYTLTPGARRYGPDGKLIAENPVERAGNPEPVVINGRPTMATAAEIAQAKAQGATVMPYQAPPQRDPNAEPLVAIMGEDGQSVLVPRSQAVGKRPASNREQGRPVVSGDANRIADIDSSIKDLAVLGGTLAGSHATGAAAKVGASLPNFVSELTGWGADAKSKQATIDRVKQVIGKALEGGVLRKEDEYKYEKILPTIGDPPAVVKTKLEGLDAALRKKRGTELDALEDAGYDVSRYRQRGAPTEGKKADPAGIR